MQIKELFTKQLDRPINGVVKAEQLDEQIIWTELDEYVVTRELNRHLSHFFETYLPGVTHPDDPSVAGKIGIWVSGYFGSGKSHFIKILSYLLGNQRAVHAHQSKKAIDFFKEKICDNELYSNIHAAVNRQTEVILFNIDSRADTEDKEDAILKVFLRVFNERLGYCADKPGLTPQANRKPPRCRAWKTWSPCLRSISAISASGCGSISITASRRVGGMVNASSFWLTKSVSLSATMPI